MRVDAGGEREELEGEKVPGGGGGMCRWRYCRKYFPQFFYLVSKSVPGGVGDYNVGGFYGFFAWLLPQRGDFFLPTAYLTPIYKQPLSEIYVVHFRATGCL